MITDFLKTTRSKDELKHALEVLREFKVGESDAEWISIPFAAWAKLEQLEEFLAHLVEGAPLAEDTVEYMKRSNVQGDGRAACGESSAEGAASTGMFDGMTTEKGMEQHEKLRLIAKGLAAEKVTTAQARSAAEVIAGAADRLEVLEREHQQFFERWHSERRKREALQHAAENLVAQKGRHNTEIAYKRLVEVLQTVTSNANVCGLPHGKDSK